MTSTGHAHQCKIAVPAPCSTEYAAGWSYGGWWAGTGGHLRADAPSNWSDEKANGFYDRLTAERDRAPVVT